MDFRQTPQQRLDALLKRLSPAVRQAFLDMIARKASTVSVTDLLDAVERALAGNDYPLVQLLQLNQAQMFPLTEAMRTAFIVAGQATSGDLPLSLRATFGFGTNSRAAGQIDRLVTKLTGDLNEGIVNLVRAQIVRSVNEGVPSKAVAYDIIGRKNAAGVRVGGILGLDEPRRLQAEKVNDILRDPARIREYFIGGKIVDGKFVGGTPRFTVTDRRFDKRVRAAIASGKALDAENIGKITTLHRAKFLKNRGDLIAGHEAKVALRAGEREYFQQLVDSGAITDDRVIREWIPTNDGRTRHDHMAMAGQKRKGMATPFTFPDGTQAMYPGDASLNAAADDLIGCRCMCSYRVARRTP